MRALVAAVLILAVALTVAVWGFLALMLDHGPVGTSGVSFGAVVLIVAVALVALGWGLWRQALSLLRGHRAPLWGVVVALAGGAYLIWSLGGMAFGLRLAETWVSPFAATLAAVWGVSVVLFWAVLARRLYTDRPVPQWPWEKRGEPGPDWAFPPDEPGDGPAIGDGGDDRR